VVGLDGIQRGEERIELAEWGKRAKEGVKAKGAKDPWGAELWDK